MKFLRNVLRSPRFFADWAFARSFSAVFSRIPKRSQKASLYALKVVKLVKGGSLSLSHRQSNCDLAKPVKSSALKL